MGRFRTTLTFFCAWLFLMIYSDVIIFIHEGEWNTMTQDMIAGIAPIVAALIAAFGALLVDIRQGSRHSKELKEDHTNLTKDHGNLSQEHDRISREISDSSARLFKEHDRLSMEHNRLSRENADGLKSIHSELRGVAKYVYDTQTLQKQVLEDKKVDLDKMFSEIRSLASTSGEYAQKLKGSQIRERDLERENYDLEKQNMELKGKINTLEGILRKYKARLIERGDYEFIYGIPWDEPCGRDFDDREK